MKAYDFHIHSALSPCGDESMTPNNIVNMAVLLGLDMIALSDHNSIGNVRAAMAVGNKIGLKVLPAMEVETSEEVHILTIFPSIESAEEAAQEVYKNLPDIKNRPEIFGEQLYMDAEDNIVGIEEKLLISPTMLSVNKLFDLVKSVGGAFIPAHVDKHSYSVLTNLGFIPDDIDIKFIEISKRISDLQSFLKSRPDLSKYKVLRSSDAHYLEGLASEKFFLEFEPCELFK